MGAAAQRKSADESNSTRKAILDATESIMVEEGYAAVTSRRVAEKANLKSQLVHYYFRTMDDLFVAVYERSERDFFRRHLEALTSSENPLRALWELSIHPQRTRLAQELIALSNHQKSIQKITARLMDQLHSIDAAFLAKYLEKAGVDTGKFPPLVVSYLIHGVSRMLVTEEAMGLSPRHSQVLSFAQRLLSELESKHSGATP